MVLPDMTDSKGKVRYLAIGAGKDSNIYLVNRYNMGKFNSQNDNAIYQELDGALPGGIWSMPAYYYGRVYFGAVGGPIRAFQFSNARLPSTPTSHDAHLLSVSRRYAQYLGERLDQWNSLGGGEQLKCRAARLPGQQSGAGAVQHQSSDGRTRQFRRQATSIWCQPLPTAKCTWGRRMGWRRSGY